MQGQSRCIHYMTQVTECRQDHRAGDIGLPTQNISATYLQWKHTHTHTGRDTEEDGDERENYVFTTGTQI